MIAELWQNAIEESIKALTSVDYDRIRTSARDAMIIETMNKVQAYGDAMYDMGYEDRIKDQETYAVSPDVLPENVTVQELTEAEVDDIDIDTMKELLPLMQRLLDIKSDCKYSITEGYIQEACQALRKACRSCGC